MPKALRDFVPTSTAGLPAHIPRPRPPSPPVEAPPDLPLSLPLVPDHPQNSDPTPVKPFLSTPNLFGVFRAYTVRPTTDPEEEVDLDILCDASAFVPPLNSSDGNFIQRAGRRVMNMLPHNPYTPFKNWTTFKIVDWHYSGSTTKSAGELDRLVDIIRSDEFDKSHLEGFRASREFERLDNDSAADPDLDAGEGPSHDDGWIKTSIKIPLPAEKVKQSEDTAPTFEVPNVFYRPLLATLKTAYQDPMARMYHWIPHRLYWRRPTSVPESEHTASVTPDVPSQSSDETEQPSVRRHAKPSPNYNPFTSSDDPNPPPNPTPKPEAGFEHIPIVTDIYNSEAMLKEDEAMRSKPRNPEDPLDLEYAIAPILIYSDSTQLAKFGVQALWPVYLYVANMSKYLRSQPSAFAAHHLAYLPVVSIALSQRSLQY